MPPNFNTLSSARYLELQIHGEIRFGRDVDTLVVDEEEVTPKTLPGIDEFSNKFGCKVVIFKDGNKVTFGPSRKQQDPSEFSTVERRVALPRGVLCNLCSSV